jgi:hypothetical protein
MKKETCLALTILISTCTVLNSLPATGCAIGIDPYYTFTNHPDFPLDKYAAGRLGIIQAGYARSYLLPAYRYLSGQNLSADEQKGLVELWQKRLTESYFNSDENAAAWLKARADIPGAAKIDRIDTEHSISPEEKYQSYCNCQKSAFDTAAETLRTLVGKYGAVSAAVKEWLAAQDKVFSNCGDEVYSDKPHKIVIPTPLAPAADAVLQKYRAYQIASANFYAQNFDLARRQFDAIAADNESPWKRLSAYLSVRTMVRQATLSKVLNKDLLKSAAELLAKLAADPAYAGLSADFSKLTSFIAVRLTPEKHLSELLTGKLTADNTGEITKTIDSLLGCQDDGSDSVQYDKVPAALKHSDEVDWILTLQSGAGTAKHHAIERWKQTHALPWLLAAATVIDARDPDVNAFLAEASRVESGPARWTLFSHANRLRLSAGKTGAVREELDKILNNPPADLPPGSLNQLTSQRLTLSASLDELVRYGVQTPVAVCSTGGCEQVPDDIDQIFKSGQMKKESPLWTPEAGQVVQKDLPLSVLKQLASNNRLPIKLRGNVAWTSWVRAVLVGDETAAAELAQIARPFNPSRAKHFDAYLSANTPELRKFAAVFLMLHFSSAQPNASFGPPEEDSYGDASGWWWSAGPAASKDQADESKTAKSFAPLFLTAAQKAQAKQEQTKLAAVETAPTYFAKTVLAFARLHPGDARVPEALHWLVKSTRYGYCDDTTKGLSKQAFTLLHTKYITSPWTGKTPYYY